MKRVAIVGCGAIGTEVAKAIDSGYVSAELVALFDAVKEKCERLASKLMRVKPLVASSIDELLNARPEIVVEAASQDAVREFGERVVLSGAWLVVLSVGALMDEGLLERLRRAAKSAGSLIFVPSGAIAGLDAVRALRGVGVNRVLLRTYKRPESIKPCDAIEFDPSRMTKPTVVFRGKASEAVRLLPFNVNVSATLSLAAGMDAEVEVVADPALRENVHEIIVESEASKVTIRVENVPNPINPRTSLLASLSVIELLRRLCGDDRVMVGT